MDTEKMNDQQLTEEPDYIQVIQELRENSVSKEEYDKLKEENKKLFNALATGETIQVENQAPKKTLDELRQDVANAESSLDGIKASLALRKAVMEETGEDIFVAKGSKILATDEDILNAEKVATVFQQWVDESNDNPLTFARIMEANIVDTVPPRKRR